MAPTRQMYWFLLIFNTNAGSLDPEPIKTGKPGSPWSDRVGVGLDMDFGKQPLFAMISQRIGWLTDRQRLLSENVANADTPDYKPRDLKEQNFEKALRNVANSLAPARTSTRHLSMSSERGMGMGDLSREKPAETTLSGNAVTLDVELMKISQTAHDHQLASSLYRKHLNLFRTVLGRGGA